jgi:ribosome biogenesis GTPase
MDAPAAYSSDTGVAVNVPSAALRLDDLQVTAAVRESDGRGRHTTTRREMIPLPAGGVIIDTPGMRQLAL